MFHLTKLPIRAKAQPECASPGNALGAARTLGIAVRGRDFRLLDKDYLHYDAKAAFKREIKVCHPDVGGDPARCRAVMEAYRLLKRYCERRVVVIPKDPRYEARVARNEWLSQL